MGLLLLNFRFILTKPDIVYNFRNSMSTVLSIFFRQKKPLSVKRTSHRELKYCIFKSYTFKRDKKLSDISFESFLLQTILERQIEIYLTCFSIT